MTTAAGRLLALAGTTGSAAALLLAIGSGATAGAALVNYSGLPSATAAAHLLAEHESVVVTGGKPRRRTTINKPIDFSLEPDRRRREEEALLLVGLI